MKIIKPSVEILEQQPGLDGIYKQIELAGREWQALIKSARTQRSHSLRE